MAIAFCSTEEKDKLVAIEGLLKREIAQLNIEKDAYEETVNMSGDMETDWKSLMDEADEQPDKKKRKKKKPRK